VVIAIQQQFQGGAGGGPRVEPLLDERGIAVILGLSVATTRRWRLQEMGQGSVKTGAAVRYRRDGSQGWMAARSSGGGVTAEVTL
jgi:hypothetical protein